MNGTLKIVRVAILFAGLSGALIPSAISSNSNTNIVVASILPVHSIVSHIMRDIRKPGFLMSNNQSTHHASLRPSQVSMINNAELFFWIGPALETYLDTIVRSLAENITSVAMLDHRAITLLNYPGGKVDPHIWLSLRNAYAIAQIVLDALVKIDPASEGIYRRNLMEFKHDLTSLQNEIDAMLGDAKDKKYLIAHDSLQYFAVENGIQMFSVGSRNEELAASAKQISAARKLAQSGEYSCLIVGPDANSASIRAVAEDASLPVIVIDPVGATIAPGREHYILLMRGIADKIANCK